jgi:hypothetical protein
MRQMAEQIERDTVSAAFDAVFSPAAERPRLPRRE